MTVIVNQCNIRTSQRVHGRSRGGVGVVDICGSANYTILYIEGRSEVII